MRIMYKLRKQVVFCIDYDRDSLSQIVVRLPAVGALTLDRKGPGETQDILGYGKTIPKAGRAALAKKALKEAEQTANVGTGWLLAS